MNRRETYEAPETPGRPRRKRRITALTVTGVVVVVGLGAGALTASATPWWWGRHHQHHSPRQSWAMPRVSFDGYSVWAKPRPTTVSGATRLPAAISGSAAPAVSASATPDPTSTGTTPVSSADYGTPDHLFSASSPWNTPVPSGAAVDPQSGSIVSRVLNNQSLIVNLNLISFGQPFFTATASTPKVRVSGSGATGDIPMDPSWAPNTGSDSKMNIIDTSTHTIYELQGYRASSRTVQYMVKHDYQTALGDGFPSNGELVGPTGSGMSQAAGTIRASDLKSGSIDHALSFITSQPTTEIRYPASHSDGRASGIGVAEGMRIQLDPSVDVDAISGLTSGEKMIAKALQTYGAYCTDSGGGSNQAMGIYVEKPNSSTQSIFDAAGLTRDWQVLTKLPRDKLRVLAASVTQRP